MSMDVCKRCARYIDTDDDCDCYIDISKTETICLCEPCRERFYQEGSEPSISLGEARDEARERQEFNEALPKEYYQ